MITWKRSSKLSPTSQNSLKKPSKPKPTSHSQALITDSPTPLRPLKTAIGLTSSSKHSSSLLISVNKKCITTSGQHPIHQIHLQHSSTSKYYPYYPHLKLPSEAYEHLEPENLQTDEKLQEFSANLIKAWVLSVISPPPAN